MENRSGLIVTTRQTCLTGDGEPLVAFDMIERLSDRPGALAPGEVRDVGARPHLETRRLADRRMGRRRQEKTESMQIKNYAL